MFYVKKIFDNYNFEFWDGAANRMDNATQEQKEQVFRRLVEVFTGETPTETEVNDYVWFECDDIFEE